MLIGDHALSLSAVDGKRVNRDVVPLGVDYRDVNRVRHFYFPSRKDAVDNRFFDGIFTDLMLGGIWKHPKNLGHLSQIRGIAPLTREHNAFCVKIVDAATGLFFFVFFWLVFFFFF